MATLSGVMPHVASLSRPTALPSKHLAAVTQGSSQLATCLHFSTYVDRL